jgi:hypothetical protein
MTYLAYLAYLITQRRTHFLILFTVIALLIAQPLLVKAKPAPRAPSQIANLAQATPEPSEEATRGATAEDDEDDAESTATVEATPAETVAADQSNLDEAGIAATDTITVAIPSVVTPADEANAGNTSAFPFVWQGEGTIDVKELATAAPPLQAELLQGNFSVTFVPAAAGSGATDSLRFLPVATTGELSSLRVVVKLDRSTLIPPLPCRTNAARPTFGARLCAGCLHAALDRG